MVGCLRTSDILALYTDLSVQVQALSHSLRKSEHNEITEIDAQLQDEARVKKIIQQHSCDSEQERVENMHGSQEPASSRQNTNDEL